MERSESLVIRLLSTLLLIASCILVICAYLKTYSTSNYRYLIDVLFSMILHGLLLISSIIYFIVLVIKAKNNTQLLAIAILLFSLSKLVQVIYYIIDLHHEIDHAMSFLEVIAVPATSCFLNILIANWVYKLRSEKNADGYLRKILVVSVLQLLFPLLSLLATGYVYLSSKSPIIDIYNYTIQFIYSSAIIGYELFYYLTLVAFSRTFSATQERNITQMS